MSWGRMGLRCLGLATLATLWAGAVSAQAGGGAALATTRVAPDEFGTQDYTVTTIAAASFTPSSDDTSVYLPYGTDPNNFSRFNNIIGGGDLHYYATVPIPAGVVIDYIGLEGACDAPAVTGVAVTQIGRYGGIYPVGSFSCTQHGLDTDYNATPIGYMWPTNAHTMLVVDVEIYNAAAFGSFSWVEIWWRRTVSAAPASASFNDVPTSHPFFQYIEALKASGITGGCSASPALYCPDSPLTRGQMAVFLSKALGLHWPY